MVDKAALSRLIKVLGSLPDDGGYEQVWANETIDSLKNLDHWSGSPNVVSEVRSTLRDLESVRTVLAGLSTSLEERIIDINKHIRPFELGVGLTSIPDEMVSKIFEHAEGKDAETKENLSLVSRRFRRIVLDTPLLWSHIDSSDRLPYVRTCLQRSKSTGLSIHLSVEDEDSLTRSLSFLAGALPHSSRWEDLHVNFTISYVSMKTREKILQSAIFSNLHLPSLQSLSLRYNSHVMDDPDNDLIRHFYQNWETPNLRSLDMDLLPSRLIAPKLSFWRLSIKNLVDDKSEQLEKLIATFPVLEELDFSLDWGDGRGFHRNFVLRMPKLRTLRFGAGGCKLGDIRSFMVAIRAPMLRKLDLEMPAPETHDDRETALPDMFPDECRALEDISLKFAPRGEKTFRMPFRKLRGLRFLYLETQGLLPHIPAMDWGQSDSDPDPKPAPSLHTLVLGRWGNFEYEWLFDYQGSLVEQGSWDGFKELEVSCVLDQRNLESFYSGADKKVIFR